MDLSASPACPLRAPPADPQISQSFFRFSSFTGYEALATVETLHKIVKGETKSPLRLEDWRAFMVRKGMGDDGPSSIDLLVEILQWVRVMAGRDSPDGRYEAAFAQLPPEKAAQSPPPFEVISQMVLLDPSVLEPLRPPPRSFVPGHSPKASIGSPTGSEKASSRYTVIPRTPRLGGLMTFTFGHPDSRPSSTISNDHESLPGSLASGLSRPRPNASRTTRPAGALGTPLSPPARSPQPVPPPLPNPLIQPLRSALDCLIAAIDPTLHQVPIQSYARVQSDSELTTHPELLAPIRHALENNLLRTHVPPFIELSLRNLHRHTAMGRLLVGVLTGLVALLFTFLLLLSPSPFRPDRLDPVERPYRLLLVPIYLGGVGYALGSKAGMCFWLALFGVREDPSAETTRQSALVALREKWWNRHTPSPINATRPLQPGRKLRKRSASVRSDTIELVPSHSTASSSAYLTSVQSRATEHEDSVWVILWRLTGMAWNVSRVEDPTLLRHHRRTSYRIAGYLTLLLAIISVVLYFLPYIPLRRLPA